MFPQLKRGELQAIGLAYIFSINKRIYNTMFVYQVYWEVQVQQVNYGLNIVFSIISDPPRLRHIPYNKDTGVSHLSEAAWQPETSCQINNS